MTEVARGVAVDRAHGGSTRQMQQQIDEMGAEIDQHATA